MGVISFGLAYLEADGKTIMKFKDMSDHRGVIRRSQKPLNVHFRSMVGVIGKYEPSVKITVHLVWSDIYNYII